MKRILRQFLVLVFAVSFFGTPLNAQSDVLRFTFLPLPPLYYSEDGHIKGILLDRFKQIADQANLDFVSQIRPRQRYVREMVKGGADVTITTNTYPEFQNTVLAGDKIVARIDLRAYSLTPELKIVDIDGLKNKKIIAIRNYTYIGLKKFIDAPENNIETVRTVVFPAVIKALQKNPDAILLAYHEPMTAVFGKDKVNRLYSTTLKDVPLYLHVTKKRDDAAYLLKRLEKAFMKTFKGQEF